MAEYGFIASDGTANVDELSAKLLHYDSRTTSFNIYSEAATTITLAKTTDLGDYEVFTGTRTIAHGLNFTPTFLAFCENEFGRTVEYSAYFGTGSGMTARSGNFQSRVDSTNIYFSYSMDRYAASNPVPTNPAVYYYIFADAADASLALTSFTDNNAPQYGLRISNEGYHVDDDYIQHYQFLYPPMKIAATGTQAVTANSGASNTYTIAHGLPYRPAFRARILNPGSTQSERTPFTITDGPYAYAEVDDTNLYLTFGIASPFYPGPLSTSIKYIIYAERAK